MDIHEYQAKMILQKYGVPITEFAVFSSLSELRAIVSKWGLDEAVLKVQVHAGGRGKAGGVKIAKSKPEIFECAEKLLGMKIINNQTAKEGIVASQVLISPLIKFTKEFYLGAVIDREKAEGILIASPEGGMEIEEVAEKHPEKILKWPLRLNGKFRSYELIKIAKFMGWTGSALEQGKKIIAALGIAFVETDASLLEINPLVLTEDGDLNALDAKLSIDDNALYRQKEIEQFYDETQSSKNDALAKKFDLAYIGLKGEIGCMVNGAGLAMATMDIIHLHGGTPANFLDVGGSATEEKVAEGFKIILSDSNVKAILVNIFGGIMNCVTLAAGIIAAAGEVDIKVPLVVRMEGTNVELGKEMLAKSGLNITIAETLSDAAKKVVASTK
jgi:succinyl-CoA synthetase beta subunit